MLYLELKGGYGWPRKNQSSGVTNPPPATTRSGCRFYYINFSNIPPLSPFDLIHLFDFKKFR